MLRRSFSCAFRREERKDAEVPGVAAIKLPEGGVEKLRETLFYCDPPSLQPLLDGNEPHAELSLVFEGFSLEMEDTSIIPSVLFTPPSTFLSYRSPAFSSVSPTFVLSSTGSAVSVSLSSPLFNATARGLQWQCLVGAALPTNASLASSTFLTCPAPKKPPEVVEGGVSRQQIVLSLLGSPFLHTSINAGVDYVALLSASPRSRLAPPASASSPEVRTLLTGVGFEALAGSSGVSCVFRSSDGDEVVVAGQVLTVLPSPFVQCTVPNDREGVFLMLLRVVMPSGTVEEEASTEVSGRSFSLLLTEWRCDSCFGTGLFRFFFFYFFYLLLFLF